MKRHLLRSAAALMITLAIWPLHANAADTQAQAAIRHVLMSTFDKPQARLSVDPIVVQGGHAVAGWTQEQRGGRALLERNPHGQWKITLCAGDGLKDPQMLEMSGLSASAARTLADRVAKAEAGIPAQRRALFATFEGVVRMDAHGNHPPQGAAHKH